VHDKGGRVTETLCKKKREIEAPAAAKEGAEGKHLGERAVGK
jgi:hypothetical protein